jgi:uncharacterized delta-60 repeat protein
MKKIYLLSIGFILACNSMFAQPGTIDNSFGTGGKVSTSVGDGNSEAWSMAVQSDWSIVVGGFMYNGSDSDFALIRYMPNGDLDNTFGNNGVVTSNLGSGSDVIYSIAIQPDGKILAGGITWNGSDYDFAVARYNTNGSLDNSFGNNGVVITAIGPGNDKGVSLKMQNGWSIVVGGIAYNGTDNDFALVRYDTNGDLDNTFGVNGKVITPMGAGNDMAYSLAMQSGWSIVVGGVAHNGSDYDFAVSRYTPDGVLDSTFGTHGKEITDISGDKDFIWSVVVQADDKILAGGYSTNNGGDKDFTLVRYNANGGLDNTFANSGKRITDFTSGDDDIYSLVIQPDGWIIAGGTSYANGIDNYALTRYKANGNNDDDFGNDGKVVTPMSSGNNEIYSMALLPDGKIMAAGFSTDSTRASFSMARYLTGLSLGVVDFSTADAMLIYPNPVAQNAMLEYTLNKEEQVSIRLTDMNGRTVKTFIENEIQGAGDHKQAIVLPYTLAAGNYVLTISSPNGKMSVQIVK